MCQWPPPCAAGRPGGLRQAVQEFVREVGFSGRQIQSITLAVDEAVGNVIKHAYEGREDGELTVKLHADDGGVEVRICDCGAPFDPTAEEPPPPEELRPGGRGLFLIREIMDDVQYGRENGANVFRMSKRLPSASEEPELRHGN